MPVKSLSTIELPENTVKVEDSPKPARRRHTRRSVSAGNTLNSVSVFLFAHKIMTMIAVHSFFNCYKFVLVA